MIGEFRTRCLCKELDKYNKIIIYGTGDYADRIYPLLLEHGLRKKISCFTQTEESKIQSIDGIPIIKFNMLEDCKKDECAVLIAVSEIHLGEIKQKLLQCQYPNVFALVDYRTHTADEFEQLFSFDEYCDLISDWFIETHVGDFEKKTVMTKLLERGKNVGKKTDSKLIVWICGHLTARSNKIIGALRRAGYSVVMLRYNLFQDTMCCCLNEFEGLEISRISCDCIESMLYEALQYYPLIYFFEPGWAECLWAKIMIKNKKYFGKIIIALYDVLNDGILGQSQKRMDSERYVLENADGIVWRYFSKDYLEEKGFAFRGKSIQFLDYCNHSSYEFERRSSNSSVVKLCEVCGTADEYVEDRPYSSEYIDFARVGEILKVIGNREDCIFHFYGIRMKKENIERCRQYEQMYSNFKFFIGVEHDELIRRLNDYDYGCDFFTDGEEPPDEVYIGNALGIDRKNCVRNIFFDYITAGLPIIATMPQKFLDYLQPYDVVIRMNIATIKFDYLKNKKSYFYEKVKEARKELDIDVQIPRLIDFFNSL